MLKVVSATAGHEHLFPDLHDVDQLGRIAVQVDHVARFTRGLGAGVHCNADVGLRECGRVVSPVTSHRDETTLSLFLADATEFLFRRRLGHEIVHTGLRPRSRRR